jgi:hypothetical protein
MAMRVIWVKNAQYVFECRPINPIPWPKRADNGLEGKHRGRLRTAVRYSICGYSTNLRAVKLFIEIDFIGSSGGVVVVPCWLRF